MNFGLRYSGMACVLMAVAISLTLPVLAQGQTPESPLLRPTIDLGVRRDSGLEQDQTAPPQTKRGTADPSASTTRGEAKPTAKPAAKPQPAVVKGSKDKEASARITQNEENQIVQKNTTAFEPIYDRVLEFVEPPDEGSEMDQFGPMTTDEFLEALNTATGWNILTTPEASSVELQFWLKGKRPIEALRVLTFHDLYYTWDEKSKFLSVMTKKEVIEQQFGMLQEHAFDIGHIDIEYAKSIVDALSSTDGRIIADQRTNKIYVWDTQDNLDHMIKAVEELDVPLKEMEFSVQYADLKDMEEVLKALISPTGMLIADTRTGRVIVRDLPQVVDQVGAAIAQLDLPMESKTIEVLYAEAEDLVEGIEALLSERGIIQIDPRYNTLVITDLPKRLEKMAEVIEALDRPLETRTWIIRYEDLEFVADQVIAYVPETMGEVVVNERVHQITVTALPARLDQLDALITTWDVVREQVLIEAFIVEVGSGVEREFNIDWSFFGTVGRTPIVLHGGDGFTGPATASGSGEVATFGQLPYARPLLDSMGDPIENVDGETVIDSFGGQSLAVALDYLDKQDKATILSSPRIVVKDGEEALFQNATQVPYVSATTYNQNYNTSLTGISYNNRNQVEFIDVGTILSVLPRVSEDETILIDIMAEDSTFVDKSIVANDQLSTVPEKTVRSAQTKLRVHSGDTIVLGGLRRDRSSKKVTKTPVLGDIPVLGKIFSNPDTETRNNNLMIFITTTIVDSNTHPEAMQLADAEATIAKDHRREQKSIWGRMQDKMTPGDDDVAVAVGQQGDIHLNGTAVTLDELKLQLRTAPDSAGKKLILRSHPRAPEKVIINLLDAAGAAGFAIEKDVHMTPLIPAEPAPDASQ